MARDRGTSPRQLARQLAGDLDNIVLLALAKEGARRYASVELLAQDLDRYLNMSLRIWRLTWDRLPPLRERVREHCDLLDAIRLGQPERARSVAEAHVRAFAEEMRAAL